MNPMWDARYAESEPAYGMEPNEFLVTEAHRIPPGPILCLAEGQGRNAVYLAGLGRAVTAVDQSAVGLQCAAELATSRGVTLRTEVADLGDYAIPDNAYAGIVSIWAHMPPEPRRRLHAQVVRGLAPGGLFVLEAYTPAQLGRGTGGPPVAELTMTEAALRDELDGLEILESREIEREVREGKYHDGLSAVVQWVGRKRGQI